MTNLPAPKRYKNRGKGVSRHLTDEERRKIALFASRSSVIKAAAKFAVCEQSVRNYVTEFGYILHARKTR